MGGQRRALVIGGPWTVVGGGWNDFCNRENTKKGRRRVALKVPISKGMASGERLDYQGEEGEKGIRKGDGREGGGLRTTEGGGSDTLADEDLTVHVMHVVLCIVKNLTLRIEEKTLERARRIAAERSTSVNSLVREFLGDLAKTQDRRSEVRRELIELSRESEAQIGNRKWSRDELHDR